jgi:hypothetical protein
MVAMLPVSTASASKNLSPQLIGRRTGLWWAGISCGERGRVYVGRKAPREACWRLRRVGDGDIDTVCQCLPVRVSRGWEPDENVELREVSARARAPPQHASINSIK